MDDGTDGKGQWRTKVADLEAKVKTLERALAKNDELDSAVDKALSKVRTRARKPIPTPVAPEQGHTFVGHPGEWERGHAFCESCGCRDDSTQAAETCEGSN